MGMAVALHEFAFVVEAHRSEEIRLDGFIPNTCRSNLISAYRTLEMCLGHIIIGDEFIEISLRTRMMILER